MPRLVVAEVLREPTGVSVRNGPASEEGLLVPELNVVAAPVAEPELLALVGVVAPPAVFLLPVPAGGGSLTLLQAVGPGMLYPCAESVLMGWWASKRGKRRTLRMLERVHTAV